MASPHLLHLFPTFVAAGVQVRTAAVLNALGGEFRHTIVALDGEVGCRDRLHPELAAEVRAGPPRASSLRMSGRLAAMFREARPDLVLTYNWGAVDGIAGARRAGIRRIIHAEDGFHSDEVRRRKRRRTWARRLLLRWVSRVVVPSRVLWGIAREEWRVPERRALLIVNGVDTGRYRPGAAVDFRRGLGLTADEFVVGTVARLGKEKGLDLLLAGFARLRAGRPARLLVVGDGPERASLEASARSLGVAGDVIFTGRIADPLPCYQALNLFALSSRTEQMPVSLLEAMACGCPVVSTDVGDVREIVAPDNAPFVVAGRGVEDYAEALRFLALEPELRAHLGRVNRGRCQEIYPQQKMIERYRELYRAVLDGGEAGRA